MFNLEEEIKSWECLLNRGEIDELTYKQEVDKLIKKDEKRKNFLLTNRWPRVILRT